MPTPRELADDLIGTCSTFPIPEEELETLAELTEFESLAFCCQGCGWWCSTEELNNIGPRDLCDECHGESDDCSCDECKERHSEDD